MDTKAWEEADLYHPDEPGAAERRALLEFLTTRGASIEQMVRAHRLGNLPAIAGELVLGAGPGTLSVEEVAAESGVTVERVRRVLLAVGIPVADDTTLSEHLGALMSAFEQGADLMGEDAILAFTRVLGAAATTVAEAAVALFYAELGPGSGREGADELERARVSEMATLAFATVPEAFSRVLLAQFERATQRVAVSRPWEVTAGAPTGATSAVAAPGSSEMIALGFVDLVGSTAWADGLSLRQHSLALSRFESAAWSSAVQAGGRVIKMIGDEVFFAAPSANSACRIGLEVCRAADDDELLPPARGAVGFGSVTAREGDYFGPLVNLVSRLVKAAPVGGLVATEEAAAQLSAGQWVTTELGSQTPRGMDRAINVFSVEPR